MTTQYLFAIKDGYLEKPGRISKGDCISKHRSYLAATQKCDAANKKAGTEKLLMLIESNESYKVGENYIAMVEGYLLEREQVYFAELLNKVIEFEQGGEPLSDYHKSMIADTGLTLDEFREKYGPMALGLREEKSRIHLENAEQMARIAAIDNGLKDHSEICYSFPATRGIQAGQACYLAMIPVKYSLRIFQFDEDEVVPPEFRSQRQLNPARAKKIGQYILGNLDDFILPALTATVSKEMSFNPMPMSGSGETLGMLQMPMDSLFNIIDGQHRHAGYAYAMANATDLQKLKLKRETVGVVLKYDRGLKCSQQYFSDINCSAVKPSSSISALYNHRDPFNVFIQDLLQEMPTIRTLIDMENASVGAKSLKLWSLVGFTKFVSLLTTLNSRNFNDLVHDGNRVSWVDLIVRFVEELRHLPSWEAMITRQISGYEARQQLIISHAVFLEALGIMGNQLIQGKRMDQIDWLPLEQLSQLDISKLASCWNNRCVVLGKMQKTADGAKSTAALLCRSVGIELPPDLAAVDAMLH